MEPSRLPSPMSSGCSECEDDPLLIWDTLKASFVQQRTTPRFNAYHTLLSTQLDASESLDSLINKVDEQIRVIKSLSPSSCYNATYKEALDHRGHKGTAEEDIRLYYDGYNFTTHLQRRI